MILDFKVKIMLIAILSNSETVFVRLGKSKCEATESWLECGVASLLLLRRMANTACPKF